MTTFPNWSPTPLIEIYKSNFENINNGVNVHPLDKRKKEIQELLFRLLTDCRMEKVWATLNSKIKTVDIDIRASNDMAIILYLRVEEALMETRTNTTTRVEESTKYQEIAKTTRKLQRLINGSSLDTTPYQWFSDEAINTILEHDIKPDKAEGLFCLIEDINDSHKKGNIYSTKIARYGGDSWWWVHNNTKEWFISGVITPQYPVMSYILKNMASDADFLAEDALKRDRVCISKHTRKETIFIRCLYVNFWRKEFGSPLYRTFGTLCSVVLNKSISGEEVRDALRTSKGNGVV